MRVHCPKLIVDKISTELPRFRHVTRFSLTRSERKNLQLFLLNYDVRKTFVERKYDKYLLSDDAIELEGRLYVMELQYLFFQRLEYNPFYGILYGKEYQDRIRSEFEVSLTKPIIFGLSVYDLPNLLSKKKWLKFTTTPNDFTLYNILLQWRISNLKKKLKHQKLIISNFRWPSFQHNLSHPLLEHVQNGQENEIINGNGLTPHGEREIDPFALDELIRSFLDTLEEEKIIPFNLKTIENLKRPEGDEIFKIFSEKSTEEHEEEKSEINRIREEDRQMVLKTMNKFREKANRANERIKKTRPFLYIFFPMYQVVKRFCIFISFLYLKTVRYYYYKKATIQYRNSEFQNEQINNLVNYIHTRISQSQANSVEELLDDLRDFTDDIKMKVKDIYQNRTFHNKSMKYNEKSFNEAIQEYYKEHTQHDYFDFSSYNDTVIKAERQTIKMINNIKQELMKLRQNKASKIANRKKEEENDSENKDDKDKIENKEKTNMKDNPTQKELNQTSGVLYLHRHQQIVNSRLLLKTFRKLLKQHREIVSDQKLLEMIPTNDYLLKERVDFYRDLKNEKIDRNNAIWKLRQLYLKYSIFNDPYAHPPKNSESVDFFHSGDIAFETMINSIKNAKVRIWLEIYILEPDQIGLRFIRELILAAQRGVQVVLLYDYFGSIKINFFLQNLIDAGGFAVAYGRPLQGGHLFKRNHKKVLIIDDKEAYVGGLNLAKEYSESCEGENAFIDLHSRVSGYCVMLLSGLFLNSLREARVNEKLFLKVFATNEKFLQTLSTTQKEFCYYPNYLYHDYTYPKEVLFPPEVWDDKIGIYVFDNGDGRAGAQYALKQAIANCKKYAYLVTPYFLPTRDLEDTIVKALKRGVQVNILTAGKSEVFGVNYAAKTVMRKYLRYGANIYELHSSLLHAKYFIFDGDVSLYGSFNMDGISWNRNLEVLLRIHGKKCVSELETRFLRDIQISHKVTVEELDRKPLYQRILGKGTAFFWKYFWS